MSYRKTAPNTIYKDKLDIQNDEEVSSDESMISLTES